MNPNDQQTALLIMDMQIGILKNLPVTAPLISNVANAIRHARYKNIPVVYVRVGFRHTLPEISMNNKSFATFGERLANTSMHSFMEIHADLAPLQDDIVVDKRRISAFTGSDLEVILRANNLRHIVLTGVSTSGVVLSTTREAADKDYKITVLSDCCADADPEVHAVLMKKIFPRQADVITVEEWHKQLDA
ncbi:MAG: isochorismatase family cysteine hydrolase [Chitinophagaceae bacterium]